MSIKLISVNVGLPREITWKGRALTTGIFKAPVANRVAARKHNLDGDRQADLSVHGGPTKAIYVYPAEHYDFWRVELPEIELTWGAFGENLTIEGLREDEVRIGDRFLIGSSVLMVTQPRMPCYKLAAKFNRDDMIKRFLESGRSGFYLSIVEEGEVGAGDALEFAGRDDDSLTVADIVQLYRNGTGKRDLLARASQHQALPENWRKHFLNHLEKIDKSQP
jgi:MOSC domain-containing protein YiiM